MGKKLINMATGGLMSMPPYIKALDEEDTGITPYDVDSPESTRKGMPSRLLSKQRTRFSKGEEAEKPKDSGVPIWTEEEWEEMNAKKDKIKEKKILLASADDDFAAALEAEIKLEEAEFNAWVRANNKRIKAKNEKALGGYMDEFQIAEEEPLSRGKRALGGAAALEEKYDRRRAYKAFQEGDEVIAEEEIVEEPLMAPAGMDESLISNVIAEDDAFEEEEVAVEDADSVLDTSALSEEEEIVIDQAIEMFPELEAIIPKIVATEFTEDELVEGPGTGTSDSIPALLSDGEFVFTAKAVKNIGIDKLRKMMAQAEEAYDAGMVNQEETAELAVDETIV